eukprot:scaffold105723_cov28-Tisochrysis_lutea.AAC.1
MLPVFVVLAAAPSRLRRPATRPQRAQLSSTTSACSSRNDSTVTRSAASLRMRPKSANIDDMGAQGHRSGGEYVVVDGSSLTGVQCRAPLLGCVRGAATGASLFRMVERRLQQAIFDLFILLLLLLQLQGGQT